jgi:hypothetical protein
MERKAVKPYINVILMMTIAALAMAFTVDVEMIGQPGVRFVEFDGETGRLYLPPSLLGLDGEEIVYCQNPSCRRDWLADELADPTICPDCGGQLYSMSIEERDALPGDTMMIKKVYGRDAASWNREPLFVSVVLSGRERDSIHRPERCLVGQNFTIERRRVVEVPMENGETLNVSVLQTVRNFRRQDGSTDAHRGYYAYWFIGQGRVTHSHYSRMYYMAADRVFRGIAHRWAYIGISGQRDSDTEAYLTEIRDMVQELHPRLLPDTQG